MDRLTDSAFRSALSGDFDPLDRLHRLEALERGLAHFHAICVVQSSRYWPKVMRDRAAAARDLHNAAARCIRRRIDRLVKRGVQ